MSRHELIQFPSADALAGEAAARWVTAAASGEVRTIALSGGRIAAKLFAAAVARSQAAANPLAGLNYFWADERCVPPTDPDSNYGFARANLLGPLGVPAEQIHRVRGEIDPARAAQEAEAEIRRCVPLDPHGRPRLDLVLLGMGEDGHVASVFPNDTRAHLEAQAAYLPVRAPKPPARRITLGLGTLAAAREVWVLITGPGKKQALRESLSPGAKTPLGRLLALRRSTLAFVDEGAVDRGGESRSSAGAREKPRKLLSGV